MSHSMCPLQKYFDWHFCSSVWNFMIYFLFLWKNFISILIEIALNLLLFTCSIMSNSVTPWTAASHTFLSFSIVWSLLTFMSADKMMPSKHLILCSPLLLPSIFLNIWIFSNKSVLHIRWPKYWSFSFSISPSKEFSELISLGLTALIFLLSKELSSVLSSTIVQKHQFLVISLLYDPILTSIHDYWKNHSFDYMELCQQSDVSAF